VPLNARTAAVRCRNVAHHAADVMRTRPDASAVVVALKSDTNVTVGVLQVADRRGPGRAVRRAIQGSATSSLLSLRRDLFWLADIYVPLLAVAASRHSQKEARLHALGKTDDGRLLHVTFTLRDAGRKIRVISARDMQYLLDSIRAVANARDVPYQSLMTVWLQEKPRG
jgi:Ribonuclease toxin, BrnT, of type II toxin-antitoxin system/CopG antitoxin of type II toxin-antitoxin system